MISIKNMKTIQIDITNACINKCSNCTRFCGWHQKNFYMSFEIFKKAVDSLEGYEGQIGIMGGQPTLHPEFNKFINYLKQKTKCKAKKPLIIPQDDFSYYRDVYLTNIKNKVGLWSCLGNKYYDNFEDIQDLFQYQCLNDHNNNGQHQGLLIARKDLGIEDNEFIELRDKCWIQNLWSATITPKGCFFCEVAGALDMLFDGPGGWPIEKGWWLRRPQEFKEQLHWCELCGACLKVPSKKGKDGIDIISPSLEQKLKDKNAYKAIHHKYQIYDKEAYDKYDGQVNTCKIDPYLILGQDRISNDNKSIYPHKINVYYLNKDIKKLDLEEITAQQYINKSFEDWCLVIKQDCNIDVELLKNRVYNPGVLYINDNYFFINSKANSIKDILLSDNIEDKFIEDKKCYIGNFNVEEDIKYSFLVPTYNSSKTIGKCIESILKQDYTNFNIYFVDDGSTDNTVQIINEYIKKDNRLKKVYINKENKGTVYSRNTLIDLADGDYCIWCDSDDKMIGNICSLATKLLHDYKYDIIEFPFEVKNTTKVKNYGFIMEGYHKLFGRECYDYFALEKQNAYNLWSKVININLLKKSKIEYTRIDLVDDMAFVYPLYWNCKSYLSVNSQKMYCYHWGNGLFGMEKLSLERYKRNCDGVKKAYDLNYKFMLQHSPELKYINRYKETSCVNLMFNNLQYVDDKDRFNAYCYFKQNLDENFL